MEDLTSYEVENHILGMIIVNDDIFINIINDLKLDMFTGKNKTVYQCLVNMFKDHKKIDVVTLFQELKATNKLDLIGSIDYVNDMALDIIDTCRYSYYVDILKANYQKLKIQEVLTGSLKKITSGGNAVEVVNEIQNDFYNLLADNDKKDGSMLSDLLLNSASDIAQDYQEFKETGKIELKGVIRTGYKKLDVALTGGFRGGELIILGARSRVGKTAFALNLMQNIAFNKENNNIPIGLFELEMSNKQTANRILSINTGIRKSNFTFVNNLTEEKINTIYKSVNDYTECSPIKVYDNPSFNLMEIEAQSRKLFAAQGKKGIIFLDHMQLINNDGSTDVQKVDNITRGLKTIAKNLDVPIVLLCQLSRAVDSQSDKEPALKDLRGSAMIEANSDVVILLHRQSLYEKEMQPEIDKTLVKLDKVREGVPSRLLFNFEGATNKYLEIN